MVGIGSVVVGPIAKIGIAAIVIAAAGEVTAMDRGGILPVITATPVMPSVRTASAI
jgi:hypothetical protein